MKKSELLTVMALLFAVAQGAWALETVKYIERSWDGSKVVETEKTAYNCRQLTGDPAEGWIYSTYVVHGNVTCTTLNVLEYAEIILCDDATLTCTEGICVEKRNENAQLYIYSQSNGEHQGKLIVTNSNSNAAGIGSTIAQECGEIYIHGGNINVTGGSWAAGIGGGGYSTNTSNGGAIYKAKAGKITVYGGKVTTQGGKRGAGIGGGGLADGGEYVQYGGEVTATGGEQAAGVGGGGDDEQYDPYGTQTAFASGGKAGKIHIYGGKLTAQGGQKGSGIGVGYNVTTNDMSTMGELQVYSGASVTATGGKYGVGIGGGQKATGINVNISGGDVKAYGGTDAAGIGGGEAGNGGITRISGGTVLAQGKSYGAGIGSGEDTWRLGSPVGGETYITGGIVTAIAGEDCKARKANCGSAIGCGDNVSNKDAADKLKIIEIADNMRVTGGDAEDNIERVFTTTERVGACIWRNYVKIEPCYHTAPTVGSDRTPTEPYILNQDKHTVHCRYCNTNTDENHIYKDERASSCEVCGYVRFSSGVPVNITYWFADGHYFLEDVVGFYSKSEGPTVFDGQSYTLPTINIEGLRFMGYLKKTSTDDVPESIEMQLGEEANLLKGGEAVTLNALDAWNVSSGYAIDFYARYLYDFKEKWEWAEDYSNVKLTLSNKLLGDVVLTSENGQIQLTTEDFVDSDDGQYCTRHIATANYQTRAGGHTYTFSSEETENHLLTLADNADNSQAIEDLNGKKVPIILEDRKLYTDGTWNTICIPFDMDDEDLWEWLQINEIKTLESSSFDEANGSLEATSWRSSSVQTIRSTTHRPT